MPYHLRFAISIPLIALAAIMLPPFQTAAALSVPSLFSDNMVLQCDMPVPVWGQAPAGSVVEVAFADQRVSAVSGAGNRWKIELGPVTASATPAQMVITARSAERTETRRIENILVGEVWLCSGQSNMQFPLIASNNGKEELTSVNMDAVRLFTVRPTEQDDFVMIRRTETADLYPPDYLPLDQPRSALRGEWVRCISNDLRVGSFSAVAFYFGKRLNSELGIPVGLILAVQGGTPAESWVSEATLRTHPQLEYIYQRQQQWAAKREANKEDFEEQQLNPWRKSVARSTAEGKLQPPAPFPPNQLRPNWEPASLYNVLLCPLSPFAIRGVIWYQGESNTDNADSYELLFSSLIADWRKLWGQDNLPFYFVQLPNYRSKQDTASHSPWAELRDAQLRTYRSVPDTGIVVTTDIGDPDDIHPDNKAPVGKRLADWALADTYGRADILHSGPLLRSADFRQKEIVLDFDFTGTGLRTRSGSAMISGIEVADSSGKWIPLPATIVADKVIVHTPTGIAPVAVRYAWADNPTHADLINSENLPASPFISPAVSAADQLLIE